MGTRQEPIRVLLADDHAMFRQGIAEMLSTDESIEVIGEAENGESAVALTQEKRPDLVILDIEMPVMGAHEAMRRMLKIYPPPRILIVTMYDDPDLVRDFIDLGASAYIVKSASMQELLSAVHTTAESPISPRGEDSVVVVPREILEHQDKEADNLSERELEILVLVARGLSNRQIATTLHLSEATVKRHLANIYPKIGVSSRGEAVRQALEEGWITIRQIGKEEKWRGAALDN